MASYTRRFTIALVNLLRVLFLRRVIQGPKAAPPAWLLASLHLMCREEKRHHPEGLRGGIRGRFWKWPTLYEFVFHWPWHWHVAPSSVWLGWEATFPHFPGEKGINLTSQFHVINLILRVSEGEVCLLGRPWQGIDLVASYLIWIPDLFLP